MDLIKVEAKKIGEAEVNSVNLRDVHAFVESKSDFSQWVKSRLKRAKEGVDFTSLITNKVRATGGTTLKEYIVTLDLAKIYLHA